MLEKFTSRKFIIAVLTIVAGVATALTEVGGEIGSICGIVAAVFAAAVYIITEGNIDAKAVQLITEATESVVDYFTDDEENTDTENNAESETEAV
jgi:drug/metabolite transporter (DMT)-like permease